MCGYITVHNYIDHDYYITMIGYTSPVIKGCVLQIVNNISSQVRLYYRYIVYDALAMTEKIEKR